MGRYQEVIVSIVCQDSMTGIRNIGKCLMQNQAVDASRSTLTASHFPGSYQDTLFHFPSLTGESFP